MAKDIIIILAVIFIIALVYQLFFNHPAMKTISLKIKDTVFHLEVAQTISQKAQGLMNRTTLAENRGMIFIFDFEMPQGFWMKNTIIPLDMIFVKSDGTVTDIATATPEPGIPDTKLTIYRSSSSAKYVIELPSGTCNKIGLLPGNKIDLTNVK
jgi:uncharacterized protein